jgi:hypothetical protein
LVRIIGSLKIGLLVPLFFWRDLWNLLPIIWEKQDFVIMSNLVLITIFFSESFLLAKTNLFKSVIVSRTVLLCLPKLWVEVFLRGWWSQCRCHCHWSILYILLLKVSDMPATIVVKITRPFCFVLSVRIGFTLFPFRFSYFVVRSKISITILLLGHLSKLFRCREVLSMEEDIIYLY